MLLSACTILREPRINLIKVYTSHIFQCLAKSRYKEATKHNRHEVTVISVTFVSLLFPSPFHRNALQRNKHSTGHFCSIQKQFYSSDMVLTSFLFHQRIQIPQEDFNLTQGILAVEIACNVLSLDATICKWSYCLQCRLPWILCPACVFYLHKWPWSEVGQVL